MSRPVIAAANPFGPALSADELEQAAIDTLKLWISSYLAEFERRSNREHLSIPRPRSWSTVNVFDQGIADQTPAIILVSEGIVGKPEKRSDGRYDAWFQLGIGVVVNAATRPDSNAIVKLYAAAVTLLLVHKGSFDGYASAIALDTQGYAEAPADYLPVGAVAQVNAAVLVTGIAQSGKGPLEPDEDPGDWGVVPDRDHVHVDIEVEDRS